MASLPLPGNCRDDFVLDTYINVDGFLFAASTKCLPVHKWRNYGGAYCYILNWAFCLDIIHRSRDNVSPVWSYYDIRKHNTYAQ